jgi:ZIP family zinc transporter
VAFGGGVLISAVAFDLVQEAVDTQTAQWPVLLGICAGSATFFGGGSLIDRVGGANRKDPGGDQASGAAMLADTMMPEPTSTAVGSSASSRRSDSPSRSGFNSSTERAHTDPR